MGELISVIVPVYNTGSYLRRCIESIVAQDYDNLEIIIVDDGSSDSNTSQLCDELGNTYSNVCVYHKPNGGLSSARNFGILHSNGVYIGFVDSDDVIAKDMYSSLFRHISSYKVGIAIGGMIIEENGKPIRIRRRIPSGLYENHDLMHYFFLGYFHSSCTNLYRRSLFDGVLFPENEINEDYMLNYYLYKDQCVVYVDERPYYSYIKRSDSITSSRVSLKYKDWLKHTSIILEENLNGSLISQALYQYIHSNIVLGNKCLLGLVQGEHEDANILYKIVTTNLHINRKEILINKYLNIKNRVSGYLLATMPHIYMLSVLFVLRLKKRLL